MKSHLYKIKELSYLTVIGALTSGLSFGVTILLARDLGPEAFGYYSYIGAIAAIISIFILFSFANTIPQIFVNTQNLDRLISNFINIKLVFLVLSIVGLLFFENDKTIIFGTICLLTSSFQVGSFYEVKNNNVKFSKIILIEKLAYCSIILTYIFSFKEKIKLEYVFSIYALISLLSLFIQFKLLKFKYELSINKGLIKNLVKLSLPLVIFELSTFVYGGVSKFYVEKYLDFETLGIFSSGLQLTVMLNVFIVQVERVFRIKLFQNVSERNYKLSRESLSILGYWGLFLLVPVVFFSGLLYYFSNSFVLIIYGNDYINLVNYIPYISIILILICFQNLITNLFISIKKQYLFTIITSCVSIFALCFLSKLDALKGLQYIFSIIIFSYVAVLTISLFYFFKFQKID